jgi:hypothetical protein
MGIRFYCPNGHKLNVKDFQAGQKGICPHCGVKIQIPLVSTRPSSREEKSHRQGGAMQMPTTMPCATAAPQALPTGAATSPVAVASPVTEAVQPPTSFPSASTTFGATPAPSSVPRGGIADPLVEAGDAVWYVRPPSGGQFGPAGAAVMRTWLAEGRVSADALVWREGWRDWQQAGNVFSQLTSGPMAPGILDTPSEPVVSPVPSRPVKHRSHAHTTQAIVIGALVVVVLILFVILLVVLSRQ